MSSGSSSDSRSSSPSAFSSSLASERSSSPVSSASSDSERSPQLGKRKRKDVPEQSITANAIEDDEAPVLSHAEKRRQKKKQAQSSAADVEPTAAAPTSKNAAARQTEAAASEHVLPKRQNSVWVGNLSFKTTEESLKVFFDGVGEITRVHMPIKSQPVGQRGPGVKKENRGFAYVDFASPDSKVIAITMSEQNLDGRRLLIKDGDDFKGRPTAAQPDTPEGAQTKSKFAQKVLAAQKESPAPTLFFGNLSFESTEEGIREMLVAHSNSKPAKGKKEDEVSTDGPDKRTKKDSEDERMQDTVEGKTLSSAGIRKIRVGTFEDSGKCKGWAFVDFHSVDAATAVLINPKNHKLDGRQLKVEYASAEAVRRGGGSSLMPGAKPERKTATTGERKAKRQEPREHKLAARRMAQPDTEDPSSQDRPVKKRRLDEDSGVTYSAEAHAPKDNKGIGGKSTGKEKARRSDKTARTRPGAALALAQRQSVAIKPSEGSKIVF